ncbi:MAG TPA: guanylate kinase [Ignavibacteriaceae bacterium]|nr:guanylate kinase [Ignavibacteriaceae bacterium]
MSKSKKGEIIAVSAPSGGGKTTIVKQILKKFPEIIFSVSATTRPKRESEKNGVEYYFISEEEFNQKIKNNEFVEWEKFYDYYYGTFKSVIEENIKKGKSVLLEVDVKGAISLKRIYPEARLIYITPPSFEELVKRLRERRTESETDIKKRIERANMELSVKDKFDYFVDNKDLNKAIKDTSELINKILHKEK